MPTTAKPRKKRRAKGNGQSAKAVAAPAKDLPAPLGPAQPAPVSERGKLATVVKALDDYFVEAQETRRPMLLAFLCKQHVFLMGPPGVAKSALIDALYACIDGSQFSMLMSPFTTPDEVIGEPNVKHLSSTGELVRNLKGGVADSTLVFLDEVFKSNESMLNSLLKLMNERVFTCKNRGQISTPLAMLASASNEYPTGESLGALYDRFLFRYEVSDLSDAGNLELLRRSEAGQDAPFVAPCKFSLDEWEVLHKAAMAVPIPDAVLVQLNKLASSLRKDGVRVSPRRLKAFRLAVKANAYLEGEAEANVDHLQCGRFVLWGSPAERDIVMAALGKLERTEATKALAAIDDIIRKVKTLPASDDVNFREEAMAVLGEVDSFLNRPATSELVSGKLGRKGTVKVSRRLAELREARRAIAESLSNHIGVGF